MPKLMVLEETTKYDNGKHYTRKEGRKERREEAREGGRRCSNLVACKWRCEHNCGRRLQCCGVLGKKERE
jgi:hypothetical protein